MNFNYPEKFLPTFLERRIDECSVAS